MDNYSGFIGMGRNPNPNVPDIPVGFGMELMMNKTAHAAFSALTDGEKARLIAYIQGGVSGEDAKHRIDSSINNLNNGNLSFF